MQTMDIKPEPKTAWEAWQAWKNHRTSIYISNSPLSKKIPVKVVSQKCNPWQSASLCTNPNCGPFNHSMAGMAGGDLPPGFIEP